MPLVPYSAGLIMARQHYALKAYIRALTSAWVMALVPDSNSKRMNSSHTY
jgi:hypothetical protein